MATQEERDARATLERLKDKVDALIVQMESALASDPVPMSALRRRMTKSQKVWSEFVGQYDQLRAIAGENQAEQDRTQHVNLQRRYLDVHALAEDALADDQDAEDVRPQRAHFWSKGAAIFRKMEGSTPSHRHGLGRDQDQPGGHRHRQPRGIKGQRRSAGQSK